MHHHLYLAMLTRRWLSKTLTLLTSPFEDIILCLYKTKRTFLKNPFSYVFQSHTHENSVSTLECVEDRQQHFERQVF